MISRRAILSGLVVATVGAPRLAFAQTPRAVRRVVLYTAIPRWKDNVIEGLRDLGWVDRRNVVVEWRTTVDAYEADLRQMLQRPVDVLIVGGPVAIRAAMTMTDKVPIVAIDLESDPVASGFGKSLGRPGKNVSGIWMDLPQLAGKQLQFLQETVPGLSRVGVVWDDRIGVPQWTETRSAARALNLSVQAVALHEVAQTDDVMKHTLVERPQALLFLVLRALPRLAALAIQYRLPSIHFFRPIPSPAA